MDSLLKNKELTVTLSTQGGALTSIKTREGLEYLWQGNPLYWSGQAPVLFPICGSLRGDEAVTEDGKKLSMPRHGIVRKEAFKLESESADTVCFSIESDGNRYAMYPYRFRLLISYRLEGRSIRVNYQITNQDSAVMPFFIGGHPGFNCPLDTDSCYSDYQLVFEKNECTDVPLPVTETGLIDVSRRTPLLDNTNVLPLSHTLFEKDAVILDRLSSRKVRMVHKEKELGVELDFEQFPYLILWSAPNAGPFLAMEPWFGLSTCSDEDDVLEHKRNVITAEPGETKELGFSIKIL